MKGGSGVAVGVSAYPLPAKRRWRGFVIAVLGLVILSMLVPLIFLLGFQNGFHSPGFPSEQGSSPNFQNLGGYNQQDSNNVKNHPEHDQSRHVKELIKRLGPTLPKEIVSESAKSVVNGTYHRGSIQGRKQTGGLGSSKEHDFSEETPEANKSKITTPAEVSVHRKEVDESEILCELRFGSYCLWHHENKEDMKDSTVRKMKDRLFVARAYYPSIAKLHAQEKLSRELKQNIQDFERLLSETTSDTDLPSRVEKMLLRMEAAIARAKSVPVECSNVDKKFRQLVDLTEDEAHFHMKQSAFLYQLSVQTMPKSIHCLSMRLTVEYFHSPMDVDETVAGRYLDPALHHYVIFSNNILASSVVINSTVMHAKESRKLVFHVLTDGQSYYAMKYWFFRHTYKESTVQVLNAEDHRMMYQNKGTTSHLSLPEEFRVSFQSSHEPPKIQYRTEYASLFSHSHYLLPEIFQKLDKVVVLDDDVLVQKDLSALWNINMEGKVNGAIEHCAVRLGQLNNYLGSYTFNSKLCSWMSGLNVIDLARWRELNLTRTFQSLVQKLNAEGRSNGAVASLASLLTFQDKVYALDGAWLLSGLGHDYEVDVQTIKKAAALHYNGKMKPWLELGIPKYKSFWVKFLNREDQFLSECNVNP